MKLSAKSRCGTRLLIDLARHGRQGPVRVTEISHRQKISVKYLEQLIRPLKQAGLVLSVRGPKGGHRLAKKPEDITLGQIVRLFESQTDLVACISHPEKCAMADDCRVRLAWQEANQALYRNLNAVTIADLVTGATKSVTGNGRCPLNGDSFPDGT
ncbi:MAG: Rrf2 family transcriptional regulator [Deltaproteobacteria bacterium]|nr:Rrf2 family transcriptional regulator [Deltaproteobacteria bacterium]